MGTKAKEKKKESSFNILEHPVLVEWWNKSNTSLY